MDTYNSSSYSPDQKGTADLRESNSHGLDNGDHLNPGFDTRTETLNDLNSQLEEISAIIRAYNTRHFQDNASQLDCISSLIETRMPDNNRASLLQVIRDTGYEKMQQAFISLNQVCEDVQREREDLFSILKRHRLNFPVPEDDQLKLYRFGQFLNVTLIHYKIQKNKGFRLTDLQQQIKWESARILKPLLVRLILLLRMEFPDNKRA